MPKIYGADDEETNDWRKVDTASTSIDKAIERKRGSRGFETNLKSLAGICASCDSYVFVEDDMHLIVFSGCKGMSWEGTPVPLKPGKVVRNCSEFIKKGQMNLQTMFQIATLVDPPEETKIKGFVPNKTKEKKDEN
jgi:hypothetical protein